MGCQYHEERQNKLHSEQGSDAHQVIAQDRGRDFSGEKGLQGYRLQVSADTDPITPRGFRQE